ncbi:MAG: hypothetical protein U0003_03670 [Vampirovibrionales bacterium]
MWPPLHESFCCGEGVAASTVSVWLNPAQRGVVLVVSMANSGNTMPPGVRVPLGWHNHNFLADE